MPYTADWTPESLTREEVEALSGATVLEFGADWCPHCQAVQSPLREVLENLSEVRHLKVEDGKGRRLGRTFAVKIWPNFVLLRDGQMVVQLAHPETAALLVGLKQLT